MITRSFYLKNSKGEETALITHDLDGNLTSYEVYDVELDTWVLVDVKKLNPSYVDTIISWILSKGDFSPPSIQLERNEVA